MPRTPGRWNADSPQTGAFTFIDSSQLHVDSANLLYTRNTAGDYSLNRTAAAAETYHIIASFGDFLNRIQQTGVDFKTDIQEQFGGQTGPMDFPGKPPFKWGGSGQAPWLQPPTGTNPGTTKGMRINNLWVVYNIGVAALTTATVTLQSTTYADNFGLGINTFTLTPSSLQTAARAGNYVTVMTVNAPAFLTSDLSEMTAEMTITMATGGTIKIYGIGAHYDFNYN
jgi:hypothetical protein